MPISQGQAWWRERFEDRHRFGIALDSSTVQVTAHRRSIMARTIKLPARSNAQSFEPSEVADVRLSLLNPDLPKGEGVIIADATDTAPKARVRNRNMVKLLSEPQTIESDLIPAEFWLDAEDGSDTSELPEWIEEYRQYEGEDPTDSFDLPAVNARAHTVSEGDDHYPVLSLKP